MHFYPEVRVTLHASRNRLAAVILARPILPHTERKGVTDMKMIRAILRPETAEGIAEGLADAGFVSMTQVHVIGRGKQKGITVGTIHYEELPKTLIMMVVANDKVDEVLQLVKEKAFTGNFGDGKIFVSPVEEAYTVRTGAKGL